MAKEILIYSELYDYTAIEVCSILSELDKSEDLTIRFNCPGGFTANGYSIISMLSEFTGKKTAIIDGDAMSMAAIMLLYFDTVIANDLEVKSIMFHKGAYSGNFTPTEDQLASLNAFNSQAEKDLRTKITGKPGAESFIKKIFAEGVRNDVSITAKEAKKLGIVTEVRKLKPSAFSGMRLCAMVETKTEEKEQIHTNPTQMEITQEQLDAKLKAAKEEGRREEFSRTMAWVPYMEIDNESAMAGIQNIEAKVDGAVMAKMQATALKSLRLQNHKEDNTGKVDPTTTEQTPEQIEAAAKEAEIEAVMNIQY